MHRLGQELVGAARQGGGDGVLVAVGGDHEHRQVGPLLLDPRAPVRAAHAGHIDVGDQ